MADITLSSAVRNNLLSLQNTADLLGKTQERLATGLKVNSALDDPTAFFTAASLESRSGDLNRLLDSVGLGVQTVRAADTGIKAITDLVESAEAAARQALQATGPQTTSEVVGTSSASFNPGALSAVAGTGASLTPDAAASGSSGAIAADETNNDALSSAIGAAGADLSTLSLADDDTVTITVGDQTLTIGFADDAIGAPGPNAQNADVVLDIAGGGVGGEQTIGDLRDAISTNLANATATITGSNELQIRADTSTDVITIQANRAGAANDAALTALGFTASTTAGNGSNAGQGVATGTVGERVFGANDDLESLLPGGTSTLAVALGGNSLGTVTFGAGANQISTRTELQQAVDGFTGVSATIGGGNTLDISTTDATDANSQIALTANNNNTLETVLGFTPDSASGNVTTINPTDLLSASNGLNDGDTLSITIGSTIKEIQFGRAGNQVSTQQELANALSTTLNGSASVDANGNISVNAANAGDVISIAASSDSVRTAFGLPNEATATEFSTLINGTNAAFSQGDQLSIQIGSNSALQITFGTGNNEVNSIAELNATLGDLQGGTATLDNTTGAITVTADNTAEAITISEGPGTTASAFGLTPNTFNPVTTDSSERAAREAEFNDLLSQIDQLARDASFNGNNLLQSDNLTVIFNEDATSSLTITGVDFDSGGLGINSAAADSFQTDANINATLSELDTAKRTLRSQAATFGSNLSVVEVREQFTKELTNVLETGAANLKLADSNEEGANLLALQTRQQLSSVALSLASQADQQVLRLF